MKKLNIDQLEQLEGGIACSEVTEVLNYLYYNNYAQWQYIMDYYIHGPYDLQCTE